jgi:hypothetical protein
VGSGTEWLAASSSRGFVTIWDLRFQLSVDRWRHPSRTPIHAMAAVSPDAGTNGAAAGEQPAEHAPVHLPSSTELRVRVEIMGSQECGFTGKSQSILLS